MSKKTPLSQGFIARVAAGVRYAFTQPPLGGCVLKHAFRDRGRVP